MSRKLITLGALMSLNTITPSCAAPTADSSSAEDEVGAIALKLTAPSGTACVEEIARNTKNGREVRRAFALTPGTSQTLAFTGVPAGDLDLSATVTATFAADGCVGETMYEAESQHVRVAPGKQASVTQHFVSRAQIAIDGTFEDDIYAASECATPVNVAIGADATLSDDGWGGGSYKQDMTDGMAQYCDTWAHGLAFSGGPSGWNGAACGLRQATLQLDAPHAVSSARIYHHGDYHIPATYSLEGSLDGATWFAIADTSTVRDDLRTDASCWGAVPTEHTFSAVTLRFLRYTMNNCEMMFSNSDSHGWIYELELYGCEAE